MFVTITAAFHHEPHGGPAITFHNNEDDATALLVAMATDAWNDDGLDCPGPDCPIEGCGGAPATPDGLDEQELLRLYQAHKSGEFHYIETDEFKFHDTPEGQALTALLAAALDDWKAAAEQSASPAGEAVQRLADTVAAVVGMLTFGSEENPRTPAPPA